MEKVRFGVVGTNFITDWFLTGASLDKRFELTAVYSRTKERAAEFAAKYGVRHIFTSLIEMAESETLDAVYIASPNFLHASQSELFMSRGKHVLCEKPLASNADEALRMIEFSHRYGVALMEAMKSTLTPGFRTVIDNLDRIGSIRRYFASYCQYSSRYDRFKQGELPNAFNPECSNGALMDIGVYTIYPMVALFGRPNCVVASGTMLSSGTDGQGSVMFGYNGMEASVIYSKIADSTLSSEIQGERGTLVIDRINKIARIGMRSKKINAGGGAGVDASEEMLKFESDKDEYYYEASEFIDLIEQGRIESEINSHSTSLIVMELLDDVRRQLGVVFPADKKRQ
ncbi:MAG: Gfo/Idh/MocA family oxidoreductase [Muribaculum sp.]|nr:Gfo/Idh/MocA family oxidoreductase [Muribaculaceae bacterium]MCM1081578.1 Gfo/Idh/MocA family oxidoreductase [Muribaculum sp.]